MYYIKGNSHIFHTIHTSTITTKSKNLISDPFSYSSLATYESILFCIFLDVFLCKSVNEHLHNKNPTTKMNKKMRKSTTKFLLIFAAIFLRYDFSKPTLQTGHFQIPSSDHEHVQKNVMASIFIHKSTRLNLIFLKSIYSKN